MAELKIFTGRRPWRILAAACLGLAIGMPAAADDGQVADSLQWATVLSDDGVPRPDVIDGAANLQVTAGVTPMGVEWTATSYIQANGVEWTRLVFVGTGGSREVITAAQPSGVELTVVTDVRTDGTAISAATFVDGRGRAWSRRVRGSELDGVEWTRAD
jgi:hypothetical protein